MVAIAKGFRRRWEQQREEREIAELEQYAAILLGIYGAGEASRPR